MIIINKKQFYWLGIIIFAFFLLLPKMAQLVEQGMNQNNNVNINQNTNITPPINENSNQNNNTSQTNQNTNQSPEQKQITNEINQKIDDKNNQIEELQKKIETYQNNIKIKQNEALTLQNQISLLDDQIEKKNLDIQAQQTLIEKLELEITELENEITTKAGEIDTSKKDLAKVLRKFYEYDQKTYLEIAIANNSFSDFVVQLKYLEELEKGVKGSLDHLKALKSNLEDQKNNLNEKKTQIENEKLRIDSEKQELDGQKTYKDQLLYQTQLDETKFQELVDDVRREQIQVNAEISDLESEMRQKINNGEFIGNGNDVLEGNSTLSWPVSSIRGINCGFHCDDYPFKKWFEHSGIDISTPQGSSVGAAAAGYVAIAKNAGMGYSYVLIIHGDGLATVYGHLSSVDVVPEQFVRRGEVIGASGGTPGLPGTGRFSTGPHLHFEVRVNGIPDDPMKYLPAL